MPRESGVPELPFGIVTPEAVLLEFETAGTASRVLSASVDIVLQLVVLFLVLFATAFATTSSGGTGNWVVTSVLVFASFLILLGYPIAIETLWNGRSLGMAAAGLRVVTVEGGPIRFRHAAIRGVLGFAELWAFLGVPAVVATILSRRNQRLGDMVAGTLVLRERSGAQRATAVGFTAPWGWEGYTASLDVSGLREDQYGTVRSYLQRTGELTAAARASLGTRLATSVAAQIRHQVPPGVHPEQFLLCVAAAYQDRYRAADAWLEAPGAWRPSWSGQSPTAAGYA